MTKNHRRSQDRIGSETSNDFLNREIERLEATATRSP